MYDKFARSFSDKRKNPWKAFVNFLQSLETKKQFKNSIQKGIWCDLGAGNGRHLPILTNYTKKYIGTDISYPLLSIARNLNDPHKQHNWIACDANALPFRNNSLQSIVCVALIHHIHPKYQLRLAMKKITQLLKKDGILILTLWGAFKGKNESLLKRMNFHRRLSLKNIVDTCLESEKFRLDVDEIIIPWSYTTKGNTQVKGCRIYHLYTFNELNIFDEYFKNVTKESHNMGVNAGINYFLLLAMK
jgi:SAM-dependent methyltransferase